MTALPASVLAVWRHVSRKTGRAAVLPDGCRDLILFVTPGERPEWIVSPLMDQPFMHLSQTGQTCLGLRLVPGARFDEAVLLHEVRRMHEPDIGQALSLTEDLCRSDPRVSEALAGLAGGGPVAQAARDMGVSERTLERLILDNTARRPVWWRRLARVRRAAAALDPAQALAETSCAYGFADQAHMSREFRRWFGVTPSGFLRDPRLLASVKAAGF